MASSFHRRRTEATNVNHVSQGAVPLCAAEIWDGEDAVCLTCMYDAASARILTNTCDICVPAVHNYGGGDCAVPCALYCTPTTYSASEDAVTELRTGAVEVAVQRNMRGAFRTFYQSGVYERFEN